MKLIELEPEFLKISNTRQWHSINNINEADGIWFKCPKCYIEKRGLIGVHSIICWQPHVPQDVHPNPGRWTFVGTSFEDISLIAGSSSILLTGGCHAHFFIKDGEIIF